MVLLTGWFNSQPLGTLPLGASDSDVSDYQLDIPAAMVVSSNNRAAH
jgi:hypothetical protein